MNWNEIRDFYKDKKVFITGHTGFKGSWMCSVLLSWGAEVVGYSLEPPTKPSLFETLALANKMKSIQGDVRDLEHLKSVLAAEKPEIVIHMAAQPIVRESYQKPVYTYEVNVMGTVNILEAVRGCDSVKSVINVTTDKVYKNKEWEWGYRENDELNGYDPYSNSKSCSELVTDSYINSFLKEKGIGVSTMRAGNVIGGGDFAKDRIIPDCIRAAEKKQDIIVRNPYSTRPYQHVLEPVMAYLMVAYKQYNQAEIAGNYNIGPEETDCLNTGKLVDLFCDKWNQVTGETIGWKNQSDGGPHEANFLKLDCSKIKSIFGWKPVWNVEEAVQKVVEWTDIYRNSEDINHCMESQMEAYIGKM